MQYLICQNEVQQCILVNILITVPAIEQSLKSNKMSTNLNHESLGQNNETSWIHE
jgi:hypothetical protein